MKKLKALDVPDLFTSVQNKKLPKEALRTVLGQFKLHDDELVLADSPEELRRKALRELEEYFTHNDRLVSSLQNQTSFLGEQIKDSGCAPPPVQPQRPRFEFSEEEVQRVASSIALERSGPGGQIGLGGYREVIEKSYELIKGPVGRLCNQSRAKQRTTRSEPGAYLAALRDAVAQQENLIAEAQRALALALSISPEQWDNSEEAMIEQEQGQDMLDAQSKLRSRIKYISPI